MPNTLRYWDGQQWTQHVAPAAESGRTPSASTPPVTQSRAIPVLIFVGAIVGFIMSFQSASLLTGTGALWTGVAIVCGAAVAAWMLRKSTPRWVRIVVTLLAVVAIVNVVYVEIQLEELRQDLGSFLD